MPFGGCLEGICGDGDINIREHLGLLPLMSVSFCLWLLLASLSQGTQPPLLMVAISAWWRVTAPQALKESFCENSERFPRQCPSFTERDIRNLFSNARWQDPPQYRTALAWGGWSRGSRTLWTSLSLTYPHPQPPQRHNSKPRGSRNRIRKQFLDLHCSF